MHGPDRLLVGILLLLVSASDVAGAATIRFKPAVGYQVGTTPLAVAIGDFNGDGRPDLAVANAGNPDPQINDDGNVSILLGNGDGTFQSAHKVLAGKNPLSIAVGDLNGDGRLDLVVANNGINPAGGWLAGTVSVLLGNGNGTFQDHVDYSTGTGPSSVALGDFNGDKKLDLVVAAHPANVVSVLLGNGDGTFQTHVDYATGNAGGNGAVAIADFNRDGNADLAAAGGFSGGVVGILEGNGDGTFQTAVAHDPAGLFGRTVAVGDFNGDSKLDLVISFANFGNPSGSGISVALGNGDGTFVPATTLPTASTGCHAGAPFAADFDGDGRLDVAVVVGGGGHEGFCGFGSGAILVFKGNGDGTFKSPISFTAANIGNLEATADLDGNKSPDLVTVNGVLGRSDNTVRVLQNATGADFSISAAAPTPGTVSRGQRSTSTLNLAHLNSFNNSVALTCSVQPAQSAPTCSFSPSSVTFDANENATATLTINTGAATAWLVPLGQDLVPSQFLLPIAVFGMVGAGFGSRCFTRRKLVFCVLGAVLFGGLIIQGGCGGGVPGSTTYTITITGTSGSTNHSTTVPLIVK